jgi:hypothetical protein
LVRINPAHSARNRRAFIVAQVPEAESGAEHPLHLDHVEPAANPSDLALDTDHLNPHVRWGDRCVVPAGCAHDGGSRGPREADQLSSSIRRSAALVGVEEEYTEFSTVPAYAGRFRTGERPEPHDAEQSRVRAAGNDRTSAGWPPAWASIHCLLVERPGDEVEERRRVRDEPVVDSPDPLRPGARPT